tara:strand:+ start:59 stop:523 length:465 start_codon:yes stop_codon:yes gene_type:complete
MGSTERDIVNRIKTNLAGITGDSYNFDFSASDRVVIGAEAEPIRVPCIYIHPITVSTSQAAGRTRLQNYDREFTLQIDVFVPATSAAPGVGLLAALDAGSDIMKALEADRSLGSVGVRDIEVDASSWDGFELDRPGIGISTLQVKVIYTERAGT